jgi:NAD+ kinase
MKIALNGSCRHVNTTVNIARLLRRISAATAGSELLVHSHLYEGMTPQLRTLLPADLRVVGADDDFTADAAISLGGDGSFLRTAQWVGARAIPILGINTGHLGYLADLTVEEALSIRVADFKVERRSVLQIDIAGRPSLYALNEAAILKTDTASMISADASIDGSPLTTYRADGLIISTPTGSTGYNLSVGGPIVEPTAPVIIVAPVAPHSLTVRPLVISDRSHLRVVTTGRAESYLLSVDGRSLTLPSGSAVEISRAPFEISVVQRINHHFASTLRSKLLWGEHSVK